MLHGGKPTNKGCTRASEREREGVSAGGQTAAEEESERETEGMDRYIHTEKGKWKSILGSHMARDTFRRPCFYSKLPTPSFDTPTPPPQPSFLPPNHPSHEPSPPVPSASSSARCHHQDRYRRRQPSLSSPARCCSTATTHVHVLLGAAAAIPFSIHQH